MTTTNFGRDISCTDELRTGRYVSGIRLVGEAVYRRLTTPRGMLRGGEEEANYGIDLHDLIGSTNPKADAASLPGRITNELLKDERIESATTSIVVTTDGPATVFDISVECVTTLGPFSLRLSVDDVTVELLGITVEES